MPVLLLLLAACQPTVPQQSPPPPLAMRASLVEQLGAQVVLDGTLPAGTTVHLLGGLYGTGAGLCLPVLNGPCLDVLYPRLLGTAVLDGRTLLELPVPLDAGTNVTLQALALDPTLPATLSAPLEVQVTDGWGDADADGLLDREEVLLRTHILVADSDGGGTDDGNEVALGTDPMLPTDDTTQEGLCRNGVDDDGDGDTDCDDSDCVCAEQACDDGVDDDHDGLVDCEDADCWRPGTSCSESDCTNGLDDDGDGLADCDDDDCWSVQCHDVVISSVFSGQVRLDTTYFGGSALANFRAEVTGRVYVDGPRTGPVWCSWFRGGYGGAWIDPTCQLGSDLLPDTSMTLVPAGISTSMGLRYRFGTLISGTYLSPYYSSWSLEPGEPRGRCANGSRPRPFYVDADGDGFGISDPADIRGTSGAPIYACGGLSGVSRQGGDCDDDDPSWTPATVSIGGRRCADLSLDDRDGDGVSVDQDPDDLDAGVP